jgi:hypothetical protein
MQPELMAVPTDTLQTPEMSLSLSNPWILEVIEFSELQLQLQLPKFMQHPQQLQFRSRGFSMSTLPELTWITSASTLLMVRMRIG